MSLRAYPKFQSVGRGRLCPYWPALGMAWMLVLATGVEGKSLSGIHQEFLKTKLEAVKGSPENQHRLGVLYERGLGVAKSTALRP